MLVVTTTGLDQALRNTREREQRMLNLQPVNQRFAAVLRKEIRAAFNQSRSPKGERFPPLKPSTIAGRKKSRGSAQAAGPLTDLMAQLSASVARAQSGIKPLVDTGRLRRSIGVIAGPRGIRLFFIGYLRPHIGGGGADKRHPPKRNPLPYEKQGGQLRLIARLAQEYDRRVRAWVMTGTL